MQIDAIGSGMMPSNSTAAAMKAQAEGANFSAVLDKMKQNAKSLENLGKAAANDGTADARQQAAEDAKLREACQGFEAMFLGIMLKQMRDTVPKDELFGESNERDILESMRDEAMVQDLAKSGGIGLGDMLYEQLKLEQAAVPAGVAPMRDGAGAKA